MKYLNNFIKSIKLQAYGILFYLNIINSDELFKVSEIEPIEPPKLKTNRRWRVSESVAAAYLALYGYPSPHKLTEEQVAYLIDRSVVGLRRKISRYRRYEKKGVFRGLSKKDLEIINTHFSNDPQRDLRKFAASLHTAAKSNDRADDICVMDLVNEIFASTYRE